MVAVFPKLCLWRRSLCSILGGIGPGKLYRATLKLSKNFSGQTNAKDTAISRKVVGKTVHAIIPEGNMGYDQYAVLDNAAFEPTIVAFL